ncbi:MAG: cobalt chelatase [Limnobacter sp.]|uniref:cobaltochelatase CobT-related protein n=1 Tax=Limnobacter sp. TaxID=2003368 RepID=UPI0032EACAEC
MHQLQPQTRREQRIEEICAGVIRALTGHSGIRYRGRRLHTGRQPLPIHAPHLQADPATDDFSSFRGVADSIALRLQHSDAVLHRTLCPIDPVERLIFELLEQLRTESLAPDNMPGMGHNMRHRFTRWLEGFHQSGLTGSSVGTLLFTVFQICWSRLSGLPVPEHTEGLIESTRAGIAPMLGEDLAALRKHCRSQARYAEHAGAIARLVRQMILDEVAVQHLPMKPGDDEQINSAFKLWLNFESNDSTAQDGLAIGESRAVENANRSYTVFHDKYDRQENARTLVRGELLQEYRDQLDLRVVELGINRPRLVRQLALLLSTPAQKGWSFGEEEGQIDGRRLAQLITSPAERRLFRQAQYKPHTDCVVSFLVDCSGSMKTHAEPVAIMVDVLVRALQQAGAATEVLGFTTGAWNGGRVQRDWQLASSPAKPGRLNEVLHIVFKDADHSWRQARRDLAALLKADLYREGIDGEAVDWACRRMNERPEKRRILMVISDGCPMDSATALANDEFYLANHLLQVVAQHELHGNVEICALGVGLDLSTYYSRSLATGLPQSLNNELFFDIAQLIGGHRQHSKPAR